MSWKTIGAVERGAIPSPHKDLAEGAGFSDAFKRNGFFGHPPHLTAPEWLGLLTIIAWPLIIIWVATHTPDFHCKPGDVTTTNGRPICGDASGVNMSAHGNR